jgi:hypothetical protein
MHAVVFEVMADCWLNVAILSILGCSLFLRIVYRVLLSISLRLIISLSSLLLLTTTYHFITVIITIVIIIIINTTTITIITIITISPLTIIIITIITQAINTLSSHFITLSSHHHYHFIISGVSKKRTKAN